MTGPAHDASVTAGYLVRVERDAHRAVRPSRRYRGDSDTPCNQRRTTATIMIERPAAIDASGSGDFEDMLRNAEGLDTPDGYRAELIRGKIVVSPWPKLRYKRVMKSLRQ